MLTNLKKDHNHYSSFCWWLNFKLIEFLKWQQMVPILLDFKFITSMSHNFWLALYVIVQVTTLAWAVYTPHNTRGHQTHRRLCCDWHFGALQCGSSQQYLTHYGYWMGSNIKMESPNSPPILAKPYFSHWLVIIILFWMVAFSLANVYFQMLSDI